MPTTSHLITAEALLQALHDEEKAASLVVVDCRFDLTKPEWGREAFETNRIPGAIHLSLDEDLSGPKTGTNGRHPLPTPDALAATLGRAGIGNDSLVVAYDQGALMMAARLWWLLRWLGHDRVCVLDGGIAAWNAAALPLETGAPTPAKATTFTPYVQAERVLGAEDVQAHLGDGQQLLIDARAPERYRGEVEPLDAVAGHIPGAVNHPFTENLEDDGHLKAKSVLRETYAEILQARAPETVVHSCGSGVSATANILAMEEAGLTGSRLYAGSWSEWSSDPSRPVAKGDA